MDKTAAAFTSIFDTMTSFVEDRLAKKMGTTDGVQAMATRLLQPVRQGPTPSRESESTDDLVSDINQRMKEQIRALRKAGASGGWWSETPAAANLKSGDMADILCAAREVFNPELDILNKCTDCVLNYYSSTAGSDFFCTPCPCPHLVVWAQLMSYPYWPAKVIAIPSPGNKAFVWFFGPDHQTAKVPFSNIRFLTQGPADNRYGFPGGAQQLQQLIRQNDFNAALTSLTQYIKNWTSSSLGHRLSFLKDPSESQFDGVSLNFAMLNQSDDETEISASDSSLDSQSFRDMLHSATTTTAVPSKYLNSVSNDRRLDAHVPICALHVSEIVGVRLSAPSPCERVEQQSETDCSIRAEDSETEIEDEETEIEDEGEGDGSSSDDYEDIEDSEESSDANQTADYTGLMQMMKSLINSHFEQEKAKLNRDFRVRMAAIEEQTRKVTAQLQLEAAQRSGSN